MGSYHHTKTDVATACYVRPPKYRAFASPQQKGKTMLIDNAPALLRAAADVMVIPVESITGKRKTFAEALARQIVMTLWAESHSLQSACEIVGRIHHTSAVYARSKILSQLQYCENTRERVRKIMRKYSENILADEQGKP
jgi:chromosomal replication initiation ATPase DnaA